MNKDVKWKPVKEDLEEIQGYNLWKIMLCIILIYVAVLALIIKGSI